MADSSQDHSPELPNHLAAASNGLRIIESMRQGSSGKRSADDCPPRPKNAFQRSLDDSRSCTYPGAYLQPSAGHADSSPQLRQPQQLPQQQCSPPPNRFLAQTQSAPPTGAMDYLTGMGIGASAPVQERCQRGADGLSVDGLNGDQLADYVGLSKSASGFAQPNAHHSRQHGFDSAVPASSFPRSEFQHSSQQHSFSPQLQGSFSTASSIGQSVQTSFGQALPQWTCAMPKSLGRPQPMVQNAFTQGLQSGLRSRPQSPFGLSPENSEGLLQPQSAFTLPLQASFQAALGHPPRGPFGQRQRDQDAHQSPFGQAEGSSAFSMPFRSSLYGSNNATMGTTSHLNESLPSEATSMDVCQSHSPSATSQQPATLGRHPSAGVSEQTSQGLAQPPLPQSAGFARWQHLPSHVSASSPFAATKPDPSADPSLGPPQESLHPGSLAPDSLDAGSAGAAQWFSRPDAMRKAALALSGQLAQIDKQVLEHIVPRCGHNGRGGPNQADAFIIANQVDTCLITFCPFTEESNVSL